MEDEEEVEIIVVLLEEEEEEEDKRITFRELISWSSALNFLLSILKFEGAR